MESFLEALFHPHPALTRQGRGVKVERGLAPPLAAHSPALGGISKGEMADIDIHTLFHYSVNNIVMLSFYICLEKEKDVSGDKG